MRAFRIDHLGISEIDEDLADILTKDVTSTCVSLSNGHDVWADDEGLFKDKVLLATIDDVHRVPLPAYILAADGERSVSATLTTEEVRRLVRIDRHRAREIEFDLATYDFPAIGFDSLIDERSQRWPWRAVLAFPGREHEPIEYLMRVPRRRYATSPIHPVHGDLTKLPLSAWEQAEEICLAMRLRGHDIVNACFLSLSCNLNGNPLEERLNLLGVEVLSRAIAEPRGLGRTDDAHAIGGNAGHEITHLLDADYRDRSLLEQSARIDREAATGPSAMPENQAA